jgi:ribosomal protein S11
MLLLQIKNNMNKKKFLVNQIYISKLLNKTLKERKIIIENFKIIKNFIIFKSFHNLKVSDSIKYVIGISFLKKNTIIYITNSYGKLKYQCSAGHIKLNKKQKTKVPLVLIKLTKVILNKVPYLKKTPVAFHLNNLSQPIQFFFEYILKTQFFIIKLSSFKVYPCNGCRPKKLKRKKRKKFFF